MTIAMTAAEKIETGFFRILERPITADELIPHVLTDAYGAVATFSGTVRNHARGKHVTALSYEAYPEMAEAEMRKIAGRGLCPMAGVPGCHAPSHRQTGDRRGLGGDCGGDAPPQSVVRGL